MANHGDYAECAVRADERAGRAALPPLLADGYRRLAESYRALARQQTEMKYRRELKRMPKIKDGNA
jgi:hypothetical protein